MEIIDIFKSENGESKEEIIRKLRTKLKEQEAIEDAAATDPECHAAKNLDSLYTNKVYRKNRVEALTINDMVKDSMDSCNTLTNIILK